MRCFLCFPSNSVAKTRLQFHNCNFSINSKDMLRNRWGLLALMLNIKTYKLCFPLLSVLRFNTPRSLACVFGQEKQKINTEGIVANGGALHVHPIPTSLIPGPGGHAQSLEKDCKSTEEHFKGSAKEFQPPLDSKLASWGDQLCCLRANTGTMGI